MQIKKLMIVFSVILIVFGILFSFASTKAALAYQNVPVRPAYNTDDVATVETPVAVGEYSNIPVRPTYGAVNNQQGEPTEPVYDQSNYYHRTDGYSIYYGNYNQNDNYIDQDNYNYQQDGDGQWSDNSGGPEYWNQYSPYPNEQYQALVNNYYAQNPPSEDGGQVDNGQGDENSDYDTSGVNVDITNQDQDQETSDAPNTVIEPAPETDAVDDIVSVPDYTSANPNLSPLSVQILSTV